jgi:hypothetical protein
VISLLNHLHTSFLLSSCPAAEEAITSCLIILTNCLTPHAAGVSASSSANGLQVDLKPLSATLATRQRDCVIQLLKVILSWMATIASGFGYVML